MGCDIHLRIEQRVKSSDTKDWDGVGFSGQFSSRIYSMFARMADVRSYGDNYKVKFEPRGLPTDICYSSAEQFYMTVTDDEGAIEWGGHYCRKEDAERWVENGYSRWADESHRRVTDPDYHSYSWLTTQELRMCYDDCFKREDGTYKPFADYVEWLGLVSLCEGIESDGVHECRVVFAFDN